MTDKTFKLNTGQQIPALGLGTWQSPPGAVAAAVSCALKEGYKLVDCAYCYGNEDEVGQGLKEAFASGVKREDVFIMTKAWCTYQTRVDLALEKSLTSLGLDYVDLFLVHWPVAMNPEGNHDKFPTLPDGKRDIVWDHDHVKTWKMMEKLLDTGKVKGIGVCNYSRRYLEQLLPHCSVVPAINQIENHPNLPQQEIVDLCNEKGIHVVAYSPFGSTGGPVMKAEPVVKIAEKRGINPSTVLLSYHIARGSTVLAKSTSPKNIKANKETVELDADEMKLLNEYSTNLANEKKLTRYVYPPFGIDFGFPDKS